jgi:hypothetical protein
VRISLPKSLKSQSSEDGNERMYNKLNPSMIPVVGNEWGTKRFGKGSIRVQWRKGFKLKV